MWVTEWVGGELLKRLRSCLWRLEKRHSGDDLKHEALHYLILRVCMCVCRASWGRSSWVMSSLTLSSLAGSSTASWERRCSTETTPWPAGKHSRITFAHSSQTAHLLDPSPAKSHQRWSVHSDGRGWQRDANFLCTASPSQHWGMRLLTPVKLVPVNWEKKRLSEYAFRSVFGHFFNSVFVVFQGL